LIPGGLRIPGLTRVIPGGLIAPFYFSWTQAKVNGTCLWEFGQMTNGNTFGGVKQYGTFTTALGLAEFASKIVPNPHC